jgi:hypothetical protein
VQTTYRFAVDWLPLVLLALAFGGATRRPGLLLPLVAAGALFAVWTSWWFGRNPGKLFVRDPIGWPFEAEFDDT